MPASAKPAPSPLTREIALIIKGALVRNGREQQELARALDVSDAQISRMLNGKKHWDIEQLDMACRFLDLPLMDTLVQAQYAAVTKYPQPAGDVGAPSDTEDLHEVDLRGDYDLAATEDDTHIDPSRGES